MFYDVSIFDFEIISRNSWEAKTLNGVCVTASIRWLTVSSFFGYLLRPIEYGGKGFTEDNLSIALLSDASLLVDYIEFRRLRSGTYTNETEHTLGFCNSLIRKRTGFLRQHPTYGKKLLKPVMEEDWNKWCDDNSNTMRTIIASLRKGKYIKKGRDPQEPIESILKQPHPIQILIKMVEKMSQQVTLESRKIYLTIRKRDLLLIKMLISNPLRIHHYSIMTYREDNRGNLYQDDSGAWRLRFKPEDFKNQRGAASGEYDVLLPKWLYADIKEYLQIHRPNLLNAKISDRVFLPSTKGGWGVRDCLSWGPLKISARIRLLTKRYIPNSPGFGAHAFRHIIATDYIKKNPNGFQIVANILHDKLKTVMNEYAHLTVADGFSSWSSYLQNEVASAGGNSDE